jgi:hypothetical protein
MPKWRGWMSSPSTAIIASSGLHAVGVTRDEGRWRSWTPGGSPWCWSAAGSSSRRARPSSGTRPGTVVLEARRVWRQTVEEHVRDVIVPRLRQLDGGP